MRILKKSLKTGEITMKVNTEDDVWCLKTIIEPNDFIKAKTLRSIFLDREGRKEKIDKKPMVLKIQIEKVDFQKFTYNLRLIGKIVEGPEEVQIGSYHTINVKPGNIVTITKQKWRKYQIDKLKKAELVTPKIMICVMDSGQATMAILKNNILEIISEITNQYSIQEEEKQIEFYKKIALEIEKYSNNVANVAIGGPGFTKEHVVNIIKEKYPQTHKKLIIDTASSATISGINEMLKRGVLEKAIKENEIVREIKILEKFFVHLKKNDALSVYGLEEVKEAESLGAVEILLVSDQKIKETEIEKTANFVEKKGGEVKIISSEHEMGDQFNRMGGLGAILRFRIR